MKRVIYCSWTGDNKMSYEREECLDYLKHFTDCDVICIYKDDVASYIVDGHPLHPGYKYLSETQKADYLRAYLMHFHGGGYADIKRPSGSWRPAFNDLDDSDAWMNGYPELEGGAVPSCADLWPSLIGNCGFICKPRTPLTEAWYAGVTDLLNRKLEQLKAHPALHAQDCAEKSSYPIEWNEIGGRIFHPLNYTYREKVLRTVPMPICYGYR